MNICVRYYSGINGALDFYVSDLELARQKVLSVINDNIHYCSTRIGGRVLADLSHKDTWKDGIAHFNKYNTMSDTITVHNKKL